MGLSRPTFPAMDESPDAPDPASGYAVAGYAGALEAVIAGLGLQRPAVFGWSLGGHAPLEMVGRGGPIAGLMICGTPPVTATMECLLAAFNLDPSAENLTAKRDFTEADALAYALHTGGVGGAVNPHLLGMVKCTDGRAREIMFTSVVMGAPLDERAIVGGMQAPCAVVNGAGDPLVKPEYFDILPAPTLWHRGIVRLEGAGHAPFRQTPGAFNPLLAEFLRGL